MPFKSKAQWRSCYAKKRSGDRGWDCDEFARESPSYESLPEHLVHPNPLSPTPPEPKTGRLHRLGSMTAKNIRNIFGHLGPQFDDVHRGVFLAKNPIVAYAYARERREIGENDYGLEDVIDPPVLLGFWVSREDEFVDTDAMQTARELLDIAKLIQEAETDDDGGDEEAIQERVEEGSRDLYYSLMYLGLSAIGGDVGNNPERKDLYRSARKIAIMLIAAEVPIDGAPEEVPDMILEQALNEAKKIIPQSRLLREVHEEELISVVVLPPIKEEGSDDEVESMSHDPTDFLEEAGDLDEAAIRSFDRYLLDTGHVLYMKPGSAMREINRWHGTALSVAKDAFPNVVTPAIYWTGVEHGSAYDMDELARDSEEEEEDDE